MKERYNVQELSYLIGYFRDCESTIGKNSKAVEFYKRQVSGMAYLGQLSVESISLVEEIIGMQNTEAVKWETADAKVSMFIGIMESIIPYANDNNKQTAIASGAAALNILDNAKAKGEISEQIYSIVKRIYDFPEINRKAADKKAHFGDIPSASNVAKFNSNRGINIQLYEQLYRAFSGANLQIIYLVVDNLDAVCSGDPTRFKLKIHDVIDDLQVDKTNRSIYTMLSRGANYYWAVEDIEKDPCHSRYVYNHITSGMGINWNILNSVDMNRVQVVK